MLLHEGRCLSSRPRLGCSTHGLLRGCSCALQRRTPSRTAAPACVARGFFDGLFGGGAGAGAGAQTPPSGRVAAGRCGLCANKGAVTCKGCKGSGRNKANGNPLERYKCFNCQGFGLVPCKCGRGGKGLTPEQTGER